MDSIHGEGLFKRGLIVTAVCTSCHTAHFVLPHTDPRSSIAKQNIAKTCTHCHAQIETVHRKVIRGELWEKQPHTDPGLRRLPLAAQGAEGLLHAGHGRPGLPALPRQSRAQGARAGSVSMFVNAGRARAFAPRARSPACSVTPAAMPSMDRPCKTIAAKVDCSICHAAVRRPVQREHARPVAGPGQPGRARRAGLPRPARHPGQERLELAHLLPQRAEPVRQVPPRGPEGGGAVHGQAAQHRGELRREHSRQGPDRRAG